MKNKILMMLFALFLILGSLSFVNAEMYFSSYCKLSEGVNATTISYNTLTFDDTSIEEVGKHKEMEIEPHIFIYSTLPFTIPNTNNTNVTDCTLTYRLYHNVYDDEGNLVNTIVTTYSEEFNSSNSGSGFGKFYELDMLDRDILKVELECRYDAEIDTTMCEKINGENVFIWFDAPSMECVKCERYDFDEIITEYMGAKRYTEDYLQIFTDVTNLSNNNLSLWLVAYWTVRIFLFILLVMLIFASAYWVYDFFKRLAKQI